MVESNVDVVKAVEAAVANGDQAAMERVVYRSRWDMDEVKSVTGSTDDHSVTLEFAQSKPQVITEYVGRQPVIKFKPGVDFNKGGSIPF